MLLSRGQTVKPSGMRTATENDYADRQGRRGESDRERLERNTVELLNELRVAGAGSYRYKDANSSW